MVPKHLKFAEPVTRSTLLPHRNLTQLTLERTKKFPQDPQQQTGTMMRGLGVGEEARLEKRQLLQRVEEELGGFMMTVHLPFQPPTFASTMAKISFL